MWRPSEGDATTATPVGVGTAAAARAARKRRTVGAALRRVPGSASSPAAATVVGVLGVITYQLLRAASDQFYAPLGLSPEDVGLGQAELLGRSFGVLLLSLVFATLLLALWIEVVGLRDVGKAIDKAQRGRYGAAVGVASVLLLVLMITAPTLAVVLLLAPVLVFGVRGVWNTSMSVALVRAVSVIAALLAVLAMAALVFVARSSVDQVREGRGLLGSDRFLVAWEASVVEVGWLGEPRLQPEAELLSGPRCGVYLGAHDGFVVLVDPRDDTTVRLPAGDVALTTLTESDDSYPVCGESGVRWERFDRPQR